MNQFFLDKIVKGLNKTNEHSDIYQTTGWEELLNLYKNGLQASHLNNEYDFSEFDGWQKVIIEKKIHAIYHLNKKKSKKWIISCHGYTSSKESGALGAWNFNQLGYNILAFDFLNHGESGDGLVTFGVNEVETLITIINYVKKTFKPKHIGLIGFSMGAHTVNIYGLRPDLNRKKDKVKFIVSDGTFYSMKEVLAIIGRLKFQLVDTMFRSIMGSLIEYYKTEYHVDLLQYDFNILKKQTKTTVPTLFFHTRADKITNYLDSEKIYILRHSLSKADKLHIYQNGEHLQAQNIYFKEYNKALKEFLESIL